MTIQIINGDCLDVLPTLEANSVHCVVTDPPYHLISTVERFGKPGQERNAATAGKHQYGRLSRGFMGKAWDGGDIAFRPETWAAVHRVLKPGAFMVAFASTRGYHRMVCAIEDAGFVIHPMLGWLFASGFPKATRFQQPELEGWRYGQQALKPALEPICLAQKPLDGTGSANWDAHGCGGLNIEACRVEGGPIASAGGRWPANVLHDGSPEVEKALAAFGERTSGSFNGNRAADKLRVAYGAFKGAEGERAYEGNSGSASRFFFSAKADTADRADSRHPTVKPAALMRWLVQLVTPPGGAVLDPFAGTGSTGLAADQLGFDAVLIEKDPTYAADARRKIERDGGLFSALQPGPVARAPEVPMDDLFTHAVAATR